MDSYPWLEPTWIDPPTFSSMAGSGAASGIGIRITGSVSSWSGFGAPVWGMPGLPLMPLAIVFNSLQYGFDKTINMASSTGNMMVHPWILRGTHVVPHV